MDKVKEVKVLQAKGYSIRKIVDETGYTKRTKKNLPISILFMVNMVYSVQGNCPLLEMK